MSRLLMRRAAVAGVLLANALPLPAQQAATRTAQRDVIAAEEIERLGAVEDAYQVVLRLRPEFLRVRGRPQIRSPMSTERQTRQTLGAGALSTQPSFSAAPTGQAPNPDAPEFTSDRVSGRTAARGAEPAKHSPAHLSPGSIAVGAVPPDNPDGPPSGIEETGIVIYVGNVMYGGVEELTRILAANVAEIRHLSPSEAQFRYGPRHEAGVILVTLK